MNYKEIYLNLYKIYKDTKSEVDLYEMLGDALHHIWIYHLTDSDKIEIGPEKGEV